MLIVFGGEINTPTCLQVGVLMQLIAEHVAEKDRLNAEHMAEKARLPDCGACGGDSKA